MLNNVDRAKQFMPFDALKGLKEEIMRREVIKQSRKILSEDQVSDLDRVMQVLEVGDVVDIKYYYCLEYVETVGRIKKIDRISKNIVLFNITINFDDIIDIEII